MIFIDEIRKYPTKIACFKPGSCHLFTAPTHDFRELHTFASRLGLRREWFQPGGVTPHYDLTIGKRYQAVSSGAVEVDLKRHGELIGEWRAFNLSAATRIKKEM